MERKALSTFLHILHFLKLRAAANVWLLQSKNSILGTKRYTNHVGWPKEKKKDRHSSTNLCKCAELKPGSSWEKEGSGPFVTLMLANVFDT